PALPSHTPPLPLHDALPIFGAGDPLAFQRVACSGNPRHRSRLACAMRATAYLVLLGTLLLWSGNWIVARAVRDDIAPGIATAGRLVVVLLILLPFTFKNLVVKAKTIKGRNILLAIGFF